MPSSSLRIPLLTFPLAFLPCVPFCVVRACVGAQVGRLEALAASQAQRIATLTADAVARAKAAMQRESVARASQGCSAGEAGSGSGLAPPPSHQLLSGTTADAVAAEAAAREAAAAQAANDAAREAARANAAAEAAAAASKPQYSVAELTAAGYTPKQVITHDSTCMCPAAAVGVGAYKENCIRVLDSRLPHCCCCLIPLPPFSQIALFMATHGVAPPAEETWPPPPPPPLPSSAPPPAPKDAATLPPGGGPKDASKDGDVR